MLGYPSGPISPPLSALLQPTPVQVFRDHTAGLDALPKRSDPVRNIAPSGGPGVLIRYQPFSVGAPWYGEIELSPEDSVRRCQPTHKPT